MTGRVHFSRVSPNIEYKLAFDADDVLKKIAASNDLAATLETLQPAAAGLQALKAKLAEFRDEPAESEPAAHRATARCCATSATARAAKP